MIEIIVVLVIQFALFMYVSYVVVFRIKTTRYYKNELELIKQELKKIGREKQKLEEDSKELAILQRKDEESNQNYIQKLRERIKYLKVMLSVFEDIHKSIENFYEKNGCSIPYPECGTEE